MKAIDGESVKKSATLFGLQEKKAGITPYLSKLIR
jgi:hypothetical protein